MKSVFSLHLLELRYRVLYVLISFLFTFLVGTFYSAPLTHLICIPLCFASPEMGTSSFFIFTELTEGLYAAIQVDFICALYLSFPVLIYQLYCFFIPSCFCGEQRKINWVLFYIALLFLISFFFACQFVLPKICLFLQEYQYESKCIQIKLQARIAPAIRWSCTLFFFCTAFFQIPILFKLICRKGTTAFLIRNRRTAAFLFLVAASFFSPPDISIQCVLASLGCTTYELFICYALINQCWQYPQTH